MSKKRTRSSFWSFVWKRRRERSHVSLSI
jgi:hypothetical protein